MWCKYDMLLRGMHFALHHLGQYTQNDFARFSDAQYYTAKAIEPCSRRLLASSQYEWTLDRRHNR